MTGFVYKLLCPATDQTIYIGSTITDIRARLSCHVSTSAWSNAQIHRYIREKNIKPKIEIVEEVSYSEISDLRKREAEIIKKYFDDGYPLLNKRKRTEKPPPKKLLRCATIRNMPPEIWSLLINEKYEEMERNGSFRFSMSDTLLKIIKEWKTLKGK